ncbi:MAG: cytochrome c oxidase subunit 3 [Actinobacteria bacterium]|nr:cytochrome c oxidase subunit 3 [Actinomycetota bacterium]
MAAGTEVAPVEAPFARPRTLLFGTALATGAAVMFFGALFSLYFSVRNDTLAWGAEWFPEGSIELKPGGSLMSTFAMAAVTMAWAHYSSIHDDRIHGYIALGLTALLGIAAINQTVFYFNDIGLPIDHSVATTLFYVIVGAHMVMTGIAVLWIGLVLLRAFGGQATGRHQDLVISVSIFWYAVVAVYAVIWLFIYIAK